MSYVKRTLLCMTERVCSCSESTMEWTSELLSPCQFGCLLNESQRWLTTFHKWRKMHLKICLRMLQIIFLFLKTENIVPRKAVSFAIKMHLSNSYLSSKFLENLSGSYGRRWWWWWWQRQTLISRCEAAHFHFVVHYLWGTRQVDGINGKVLGVCSRRMTSSHSSSF